MKRELPPIVAVLKNRDFRNLWLAQIFSQLAINILAFALMIAVYQKTGSNTASSLLVLTIGIPALLFGAIAGVFVDNWEKSKVLFWCNISRAFLVLVLMVVHPILPLIYILSIFISLITQFFIPAEGALIPAFVSKEELLSANSIFTFSFYIAMTIGFILSGPFMLVLGENATYAGMGVLLFIAAVFVHKLPKKEVVATQPLGTLSQRARVQLKEGIDFIKTHKEVWEAIVLFTAIQTILTTLAALAPGFADRVLNISLNTATIVMMAPAVLGILLGSVGIGYIRGDVRKHRNLINIGIIGCGTMLALLALFVRVGNSKSMLAGVERIVPGFLTINRVEVAIFLFFLFGVFTALIMVPVTTILQERTTEDIRGRVYGVLSAFGGGVSILPVVGAGTLADTIGVGKTILIFSGIILFYGVYRVIKRTV